MNNAERDNMSIVEGIKGAFEFTRWHIGTGTRIMIYGADRNSVYFVCDASDDAFWQACFRVDSSQGIRLFKQNRSVAEFVRTGDRLRIVAYDAAYPQSTVVAEFTPAQVEACIAMLAASGDSTQA